MVYDDADMPLGAIRLRKSGSGGSHNGMKNIIENMRTEDIFRVRVGIGRPQNDRMELKDYVLGKINDGQRTLLEPALEKRRAGIENVCVGRGCGRRYADVQQKGKENSRITNRC